MSSTDGPIQTEQWIEIRKAGKLLCRLDPPRCLLEIVDRHKLSKIDLMDYGLVFDGRILKQEPDLT